jgi:hypothetical protein
MSDDAHKVRPMMDLDPWEAPLPEAHRARWWDALDKLSAPRPTVGVTLTTEEARAMTLCLPRYARDVGFWSFHGRRPATLAPPPPCYDRLETLAAFGVPVLLEAAEVTALGDWLFNHFLPTYHQVMTAGNDAMSATRPVTKDHGGVGV